jgi:hypothetical protein
VSIVFRFKLDCGIVTSLSGMKSKLLSSSSLSDSRVGDPLACRAVPVNQPPALRAYCANYRDPLYHVRVRLYIRTAL